MSENGTTVRRCLVLGGTGSLGRVVVRFLAARGARVAFTYHRREEDAVSLARELEGAHAIRMDLESVGDIERAVGEADVALDGLDTFIHCAGVGMTVEPAPADRHQSMDLIHEAAWDRMMNVNLKGAFFACRQVIEVIRRGPGGNLVLVGSIDGAKPVPAPVHYAAAKSALTGMAQAMAKELGKHGIRVNVVAPGIMEQGLSKDLPEDLRAEYLKHCGLKRFGRLEEIASLVSWLALENTYVTGRTVLLDGGL